MVANCLSSHEDINSTEWLPCLIILSILSVCGTTINGFVLFVFLRMKTVFNNANKFLITLTIGQIILAVAVGPFHITQIVKTTNTAHCYMDSFKDYVESLALISAVSNGVVSYDRYLHVSLAHNYKTKMTGVFMYTLLFCPWVSMMVYIVALALSKLLSYAVLISIVVTLGFTLLFNYIRLIKKLFIQQRNIAVGMQTRASRKKRNDKAALLCGSIIVVEFLCSGAGFFTLICAFGSSAKEQPWDFWEDQNAIVRQVSIIMFMVSGCINPFFYLYNHREFKQYATMSFSRAKVGQAQDDFAEERAGRVQMQQQGNVILQAAVEYGVDQKRDSRNKQTNMKCFNEEDGEMKVFSAARATGHK